MRVGAGYGCDFLVWTESAGQLHWCRDGRTCRNAGSNLPPYVYSVTTPVGGVAFADVQASDHRALQVPGSGNRILFNGVVNTLRNNVAITNGYTDVQLNSGAEGLVNFTMSLYFCDFNGPSGATPSAVIGLARKMGVYIYDFATRNQVAPVAVVQDFEGGVWFRFTYNRSFRIRLLQVQGDGPTLSAIMFD